MKFSTKHLFVGLIVAGLSASDRVGAEDTTLSGKASDFIKEASQVNQSGIALAQVAQQKTLNTEVRNLARMLQQDHGQAQETLRAIAQDHEITLDFAPSRSQLSTQSKLEKLNGADFDQQYTKDMLEDRVATIKKFEKASQEIHDADVRQYVQDTLPRLQAHLQQSELAAKSAGVDQSTISSITKSMPESVGGAGEKQESGRGAGQQPP